MDLIGGQGFDYCPWVARVYSHAEGSKDDPQSHSWHLGIRCAYDTCVGGL